MQVARFEPWAKREAVVSLIGIIWYLWTPGEYSRTSPLKAWTFEVALPVDKVEALLVRDYHKTGSLWVEGAESISRTRQGYFIRTSHADIVTNWKKLGPHLFEEHVQASRLFVEPAQRPSPEEILAQPGSTFSSEWQLTALSPTTTSVRRTVFHVTQTSDRLVPVHLLLRFICNRQHAALASGFLRA